MSREPHRTNVPEESLLKGHVKRKKVLVPPIVDMQQTAFISTVDAIVPEIFWVGLVLDFYGVRRGIEIVSLFLGELWTGDRATDWYKLSQLSSKGTSILKLTSERLRNDVGLALAPIVRIYKPVGLEWVPGATDEKVAWERLEATLRRCIDRFDQPYVLILATLMYSMGLAGKMNFMVEPPNIEAVASEWESDDAKKAAAFLRASSIMMFTLDETEPEKDWCRRFWRENYRRSDCENG